MVQLHEHAAKITLDNIHVSIEMNEIHSSITA